MRFWAWYGNKRAFQHGSPLRETRSAPISFVTVIMASLLMRPQDLQESESHEGSTPRQRRSCAAWRLLMVTVVELIWKFNADVMQEARKSLGMLRPSHVSGWLCGSPVPAGTAPSVFTFADVSRAFQQARRLGATEARSGIPLPPRK